MPENNMVVHIGKKTGMRLKDKREFLSMSLEEVALLTDLTPGYLGLVERGRRDLKLVDLHKLLRILGMDLDVLINEEEMILEGKIIDAFEELNTYDLQILLNTCELLIKSKSDMPMNRNIFFIFQSKSDNK